MLVAPFARLAGLSLAVTFGSLTTAEALPSAAQVLPAETVGYFAAPNVPDLVARWDRTQIGRFTQDASMRPFVEQVRARINKQYGGLEQRLGVTLEELNRVATGEAAIGMIKTGKASQPGRLATLIDATGRDAEARALLAKIDRRLVERGGKKRTAGALTLYDLPAERKTKLPARTAAIFYEQGQIGAAEGERVASAMLARLKGAAGPSLADLPAFQETQRRARTAAEGARGTVAWYVSPFEYEAATREPPQPGEAPQREDVLAILASQGFDAITGVGGVINVAATPERDFVHHTFVYAPPKPGTAGQAATQKYDLAMRMLETPNAAGALRADNPPVETWAPRQVATYKTLHLDSQNAFDHLDSLFDAFAGYKDALQSILRGLQKDPYGPKINIAQEVIANLGDRLVVMTDYTLPITPECERYLIAIDVTNEEALRDPINRWLESDGAVRKELQGVPYWEMVPEDEMPVAAAEYDPLDPLAPVDQPVSPKQQREERVLRRAAVCVHHGHLFIGSDADFLRQALFGVSPGESLSGSPDLRATIESLQDIAPGERCAWNFIRNDEAYRPTYELIRAGKMPEAQTFVGRLMNRMMTSDEEREVGAVRDQKIDGSRLPTFELARRYFGPSARSVRAEDDGWVVSGVVLSKAPDFDGPAASVARANR